MLIEARVKSDDKKLTRECTRKCSKNGVMKSWSKNKAKNQELHQERKWNECRQRTHPHVFTSYLFRTTSSKYLTLDQNTNVPCPLSWISMTWVYLLRTLCNLELQDLLIWMSTPRTHRHLQHAVISSQFLEGQHFSYCMFPTACFLQARINCWKCDWMGSNAETDTQCKLGFLGNYRQILLLTWQKWAGLLADTSENTNFVRKFSLTCKWALFR